MTLSLPDRWVWDFWHAEADGRHHLLYLQAPRALGDPGLRHANATIGHAVSDDLRRWEVLPDALAPGTPGAWDDHATWTGSVIRHDGAWHLLYTGTARAERGLVQRIGLARSDDLVHWVKHDGPVLEADPGRYELLEPDVWHDQAWRDPYVVPRPDGGYLALVTARAATGDPAGRGVIAAARSDDLVRWEVLDPVTTPMGFGQMEVPQLVAAGGRWHLLFCGERHVAGRREMGTYALSASSLTGPFNAATLAVLEADPAGSTYAGKVLPDGRGGLCFLVWCNAGADGRFRGTIADPRPVKVDAAGRLAVLHAAAGERAVSAPATSSRWLPAHVQALVVDPAATAPVIRRDEVRPLVAGLDLWDLWPLRLPDGDVVTIDGGVPWMALSAPADGHPGGRHDRARLRLLLHRDGTWLDCGPVFPDGASPGSREWAGSAVVDPVSRTIDVYYTAAGRRGEQQRSFVQRVVCACGHLRPFDDHVAIDHWAPHREVVRADDRWYTRVEQEEGEPGFIKAFRDPFFFRDPRDGAEHLLFTASLAAASSTFNGAVGHAVRQLGRWELRPPLLTADGVNNELERPHVVVRGGRYHLFFSTQTRTFRPPLAGPNGLYGFVAPRLEGPYEPLNGSGLVLANPPEEPLQAYSWLVLGDLRVASFVDSYALAGRHPDDLDVEEGAPRRHFGGTLAPVLELELEGARTRLVRESAAA